MEAPPLRVLIVDDSSVVQRVLSQGLRRYGLQVVGTASDPFQARELVLATRPDVITLDIEMPRMNGLTFLERLMAFQPTPVLVLSSLSPAGSSVALRALELGAVDVLAKPGHDVLGAGGEAAMARLAASVRAAAHAKVRQRWGAGIKLQITHKMPDSRAAARVLALGASTGGTQALPQVLGFRPPEGAGCVMALHMPAGFTGGFAARMDQLSPWAVREAQHGDILRAGEALLAPGDRHLSLLRQGSGWRLILRDGPPVNFARPSVDVLMLSVAAEAGNAAVGGILTGMGHDGVAGLLAMRRAGARTFCQDEGSSIVYGMPKEAWEAGAADERLPLERLGAAFGAALTSPRRAWPAIQR